MRSPLQELQLFRRARRVEGDFMVRITIAILAISGIALLLIGTNYDASDWSAFFKGVLTGSVVSLILTGISKRLGSR